MLCVYYDFFMSNLKRLVSDVYNYDCYKLLAIICV